jgi:L-fucose isomerase-like protein
MTTEYTIRSHFESGLGIGISGAIPTGDCTLFRLGGERLDQMFVREGTIEESPIRDDLCRTQVRIRMNDSVDELLTAPLGNHHILLRGHHRALLERFFSRYLAT